MATTRSVWVQLYTGDIISGSAFKIEPVPKDVYDLAKAVKNEWPELNYVAAARLNVYAAGTAVPVPAGTKSLRPGVEIPESTTDQNPLIVVAPQQQQHTPKDPPETNRKHTARRVCKGNDDTDERNVRGKTAAAGPEEIVNGPPLVAPPPNRSAAATAVAVPPPLPDFVDPDDPMGFSLTRR